MRQTFAQAFYFLLVIATFIFPASAEVRLPKLVSSHMVLQRDTDATIWGWADAGEIVQVHSDWRKCTTLLTADKNGFWKTTLPTGPAGGSHSLTIKGSSNEIKLSDITFGEVWVASGQSNMEMPLQHVSGAYTAIINATEEIANASHPDIRLFQVGNFSSKEPLDDVEPGIVMYGIPPAACQWQACSPETIPNFSSTAYFFARELQQQLNVPIGIVDSSWGGTSAEAWTPADGLKRLGLKSDLSQAKTLPQKADQKVPTRLYNGMIHPLRYMTIRGAIWYQGEGNTGRADNYQRLFSTMIRQWRASFAQDFSFYFAQISPFDYQNVNAAYLREAQLKTQALSATGMAVTMDIGNLSDIHPKNKQEVGRRLALLALAKDYNKDIAWSGPVYRKHTVEQNRVLLQFDHATGLTTTDGQPPSHFEIAGDDRQFHPAMAEIAGETIVVSSPQVTAPKAVRYAFSSSAMPNLKNAAELPASSFRTDDW